MLPWVLAALAFGGLMACQVPGSAPDTRTPLRLATWGSAQEIATLRALLTDFERAQPAIRVELLHIPEQYFQKLHLLAAADMMPDVMLINSLQFPVYARAGLMADLSPWLARESGLSAQVFYPQALQAFYFRPTPQAKRLALGALPRDVSNLVVYYNRDLFRRAGLSPPQAGWTWASFLKTAKALTRDEDHDGRPEQFGVSFSRREPIYWLPYVWSAGGHLFNADRTALALDSPHALAGLAYYARWTTTAHIAPRKAEIAAATMSQWFLQQRLAMFISGRWSTPVLRQQATFGWDVAPLPRGPAGSRVGIDASGYAMAAHSRYPEAAWRLIAFLSTRPAQARFCASGLIVPARRDVAESPLFLAPDEPPRHGRVFLDAIASGIPTPSHPAWDELSEALTLALEPVWEGRQSPREAIRGLNADARRILGEVAE